MGGPAIIDGQEHDQFDNMYESPDQFILDGYTWSSVERYFQVCKFIDLQDHLHRSSPSYPMLEMIQDTLNPWLIGQSREFPIREDWENVKVDIMLRANRAKFQQNPSLSRRLLDTYGPITFTGSTEFWNKMNAFNLEKVRAELREAKN